MSESITPAERAMLDQALSATEGLPPLCVQMDVHEWAALIGVAQLGGVEDHHLCLHPHPAQ